MKAVGKGVCGLHYWAETELGAGSARNEYLFDVSKRLRTAIPRQLGVLANNNSSGLALTLTGHLDRVKASFEHAREIAFAALTHKKDNGTPGCA